MKFRDYIKESKDNAPSPVVIQKSNLEQLHKIAKDIGLDNIQNLSKERLRKKILQYIGY